MNTKLAITLMVGALIAPVSGYTALIDEAGIGMSDSSGEKKWLTVGMPENGGDASTTTKNKKTDDAKRKTDSAKRVKVDTDDKAHPTNARPHPRQAIK